MTTDSRFNDRVYVTVLATTAFAMITFNVARVLDDWLEPPTAAAQVIVGANPWTAIGASGTVDDASLGRFAFSNASAGYKLTSSFTPIELRYNVVNVHHKVSSNGSVPTDTIPGWTTLEVGAQAPGTSTATAYLYRVNRCTGQQSLICFISYTHQPAPGACKTCTFANTTFDFANYLYYVRVVLDRSVATENPMVHTLRIQ